ncbi:MAG: glutamate formimidoyltransferase [Planctomycetota bacterium]|nr:glutamate formimidoyltransferase [Planctomycetota bacterium]
MLVECVPNFSCGEETAKILASLARGSVGVALLGCESDDDHNRSVLTFVGEGQAVLQAAKRLVQRASELIDIKTHSGVHPRFGATDVFPFIPLEGTEMEDCVRLSKELGSWAGAHLNLPVYLYEESASRDEFKNLAAVRKHLKTAGDERSNPDFGPYEAHEKAGFLITGARFLLVAFNVNLMSEDLALAKRIARTIRESSGGLAAVKAYGFRLASRGQVQVSMNLVDYRKTGPLEVFKAIKTECDVASVEIAGSELIGFLPKAALLSSGEQSMQIIGGLSGRILEEQIEDALPPGNFRRALSEISSTKPSPGGGTAAGLAGALGASTLLKALNLSEEAFISENRPRELFESLQSGLELARSQFLDLAEEDRIAFGEVMAAYQMSRKEFDKATRLQARRKAKDRAYKSSLGLVKLAELIVQNAFLLLEFGNPNLINDVAVSVELVVSAAQGARWNGLANLRKDQGDLKARLCERVGDLERQRGQVQDVLSRHYKIL